MIDFIKQTASIIYRQRESQNFFFFSLFNIYRKRRRKQKKTITENEQTSLSVCSSKVEVIFRDALAPLKCAAWQQVKLLLLSIIIVEKKKGGEI